MVSLQLFFFFQKTAFQEFLVSLTYLQAYQADYFPEFPCFGGTHPLE